MEISVFISLIISVFIGVVVPILIFIGLLIMKKIKILQVIKGALVSIVVNMLFLRLILTAIMDVLNVTSLYDIRMFIAIGIYSLIALGIHYYVFKKILNIEEKPQYQYQITLGYGSVYVFSFMRTAFTNLIIGDHIRVNDLGYLSYMGIDNVDQMISLFHTEHIGYFLSVGLQSIIVILLHILIVYFLSRVMKNKSIKDFILCFVVLLGLYMMMYMSTLLPSLILMLFSLIICIYTSYYIYKNISLNIVH
ncbi:MAG: hypothetical protein ACLUVC_07480 [Longibaculum sp.]